MPNTRILVVEDEAVVALDIQNRLRRLGYTPVGRASSGVEAIALAEQHLPDIILMDIRIQGSMDGIETAHAIKQSLGIPAIYLTAHTDDQTIERAKTSDPYGYLTKPFEEHELRIAIEIGLHKHSMEQRLRQQATQLEQILQAVPAGILLLDESLHVVRSNFAGNDCLNILADITPDGPLQKLGNYAISDLVSSSSSTFWREISTGDRHNDRVFEVNARPVILDSKPQGADSSQGWLVVTREVTDHRNIQRRVQQQERLAAIGQLAAGIAHDFNNLIASINMAVEAVQLSERNLSDKTNKRLSLILDESRRAAQMIRQIMDFGKQKSSTDKSAVKLKTLLQELRLILDHTLPENILIEMSFDREEATIDANATQLTQALLNLCLNSRDAMPNGGRILFDVATTHFAYHAEMPHPDMEPGWWVVVRVCDTGAGISLDVLPHVFEPFFTTKSPTQGTGLGLAQVYGIVQQHGGHIEVESEYGVGTTFTMYFPSRAPEPSLLPTTSSPQQLQTALVPASSIMLVEDNHSLRETLREVLEMLDYVVYTAENGREALDIMRDHPQEIRLVITDLIMPIMGGVELCQELLKREQAPTIIVMSGYSPDEDIMKVTASGVKHWMSKPVAVETLCSAVMEVFNQVPQAV